jgi:hypothetical protein
MLSPPRRSCPALSLAVCLLLPLAGPPVRPALAPGHVAVPKVPARAEDVGTLDGIIRAYYEVISGPAGRPREWSRDRTLYIPDVRFVAMEERKDGSLSPRIMSHQEYVDSSDAGFVKEGFDEREIHRVTQLCGNIAHVFSGYESRKAAGGPVIARGVNSVELVNDGKRWWIVSATWQDETPKHPLPKELLPAKGER